MPRPKSNPIAAYIDAAPKQSQRTLRQLYAILKGVAPEAKEVLKWGSPAFEAERILFAFSAYASHANFMPTRSTLQHFQKELAGFKTGRDTIQLPYDKGVPTALIRKIASYRLKEVREEGAKWMHSDR